ncbi:MAG: insulinase family protein [Deltaproteobacteria bacterium]|nr:insulinase family protein [Deltaproteobacteria bacterium]
MTDETLTIELPDGAVALLHENHDTPVVACMAYVRVGSADETPRQAGLAHLHEHMIFKGTPTRPVGRIAADIEAAGGDINAYTTFDHTCYYVTIASRWWPRALDVLTDAIRNASLDADELAKELRVIFEEMKRADDTPGQIVGNNLLKLLFARHPYRHPVIGRRKTLAAMTRDDVKAFFDAYYAPANVFYVLAGDFDAREARRMLEATARTAKAPEPEKPARPAEPRQTRPRAHVALSDVQETTFEVAWRVPSVGDPDSVVLDVLALVLGSGESSRLVQRVKRGKRLVHEVYAYNYSLRDHGVLAAGGVCAPRRTLAAVAAVLREAERFRQEPISNEELERAKRNIEADFVFERETPSGLAKKLGYSYLQFGRLDFDERYLATLAAVDAEAVRRAAWMYLDRSRANVSVLAPKPVAAGLDAKAVLAAVDAIKPVRAARAAGASTPEKATPVSPTLAAVHGRRARLRMTTLDNGMRLIVKETAQAPIFSMRTCVAGGSRYEKPETAGISRFLSRILTRGTKRRDALEFAKTVESLAGGISGFSGRNSIGITTEFLSRHLRTALELTAEALWVPSFDEAEIDRERHEQIASIRRREDALERRCMDLFLSTLFVRHPYGLPGAGTEESVRALTANRLRAFHRRLLDPRRMVVAIAGDVRFEEVVNLAEEYFGRHAGRTTSEAALAPEPIPDAPRSVVVHRDKEQAHLIVGFQGARLAGRDRHAIEVLNALLSGQGGRLFMELRDRRHLAYSVSSFNQEGVEPGAFGIYIGTSHGNVDAARKGIWEQIERLRSEPIGEDELEHAKNYLIGSTQIEMAHMSSVALSMALDELLGLGYRDPFRLAKAIERVQARDVLRAARHYLRPEAHVEALITAPGRT